MLLLPFLKPGETEQPVPVNNQRMQVFTDLRLGEKGLSETIYQLALKGFERLEKDGKLRKNGILTIVDYSQSSKNKRMYVIDLINKALLFQTYVAHGKKTGDEFAEHFSNNNGSHQSSLGFFITGAQIIGGNVGFSLILEGIEKGFNDNALKREIIIHGADYATENFIKRTGRLGRSFGCPSLPPDMIKPVVEVIKGGTCLFVYHQDQQYLAHSSLLN